MYTFVVLNPLTGEEEVFMKRTPRARHPGTRHVQVSVSLAASHVYVAERLRKGGLSDAIRSVLELIDVSDEWTAIAKVRGGGDIVKGLGWLLTCAFHHEEGKGFQE